MENKCLFFKMISFDEKLHSQLFGNFSIYFMGVFPVYFVIFGGLAVFLFMEKLCLREGIWWKIHLFINFGKINDSFSDKKAGCTWGMLEFYGRPYRRNKKRTLKYQGSFCILLPAAGTD